MEQAERTRLSALQIYLSYLPDPRHIRPKDIFDGTIELEPALPGFGQHCGYDVYISMIRSPSLLEDGVSIKLRMRRGVIAPMERAVVGFL
jgi:hypothetical protein